MNWIIGRLRRIGLNSRTDIDERVVDSPVEEYTDTTSSKNSNEDDSDDSTQCNISEMPHHEISEDRQVALDLETNKRVIIVMKNLRFHANGVFSNVYRGNMTHPIEREIVVKKSFPQPSQRAHEMILLSAMRRSNPRNIIQLLYTYKKYHENDITNITTLCEVLILPFMRNTLDQMIPSELDMIDIKLYTWQLFNGLHFLEINNIVHRDIKPSNILVDDHTGELLIGDFGNAKVIEDGDRSTPYQVTRFYRAPELLYQVNRYNYSIDIWSAGCVMGEMLKGRILFPGRDTSDQIRLLHQALGPPNDIDLMEMGMDIINDDLPKSKKIRSLRKHIPNRPKSAVKFLAKILQYSPFQRLHGSTLLEHEFFDDIMDENCKRSNGISTFSLLIRQQGSATRYYPYKRILANNRGKNTPIIPPPDGNT